MELGQLYGAPNGIIAANTEHRQNVLAALQSQKLLGEIETEPAHRELLTEQARHQRTLANLNVEQATEKRQATERARRLEAVNALVAEQEAKERAAKIEMGRMQGTNITAADLVPQSSMTEQLTGQTLRVIAAARAAGIPETQLIPLVKEASTVIENAAKTDNQNALTAVHKLDAQRKQAQNIGSLAEFALQSPGNYAQMLLNLQQQGTDVSRMPTSWEEAKPKLRALLAQATTAKEKADMEARKMEAQAAQARAGAAQASAGAAVATSAARIRLINARTDAVIKEGGERSAAATELSRARTRAVDEGTAARIALTYPQIPLDPKSIITGKKYTAANGARVQAVLDPRGTVKDAAGNPFSLVIIKPTAAGSAGNEDDTLIFGGE